MSELFGPRTVASIESISRFDQVRAPGFYTYDDKRNVIFVPWNLSTVPIIPSITVIVIPAAD